MSSKNRTTKNPYASSTFCTLHGFSVAARWFYNRYDRYKLETSGTCYSQSDSRLRQTLFDILLLQSKFCEAHVDVFCVHAGPGLQQDVGGFYISCQHGTVQRSVPVHFVHSTDRGIIFY